MVLTRLVCGMFLAMVVSGCAASLRSQGMKGARLAAETFFKRARWQDLRGAAELVVPERREGFEKALRQSTDDKNLRINDYQLEDLRLSPEEDRALVVTRVQWMRLPSVTEEEAVVTSEFAFLYGSWFLVRQDAGPFVEALSEPFTYPAQPAKTP